MINDQQRNYIDILKNTLESSFIKNGIKINANSLNEVIDISQLIMENEKLKNENDKNVSLINELQNKIEKLKKAKEDLSNSNNILKQQHSTEKTKNELLLKELENEMNNKKQLQDNYDVLKQQNEKEINNDISPNQCTQNEIEVLYSQLEKDNKQLIKDKNDLELSLQQSKLQIKQLQDKQNELLSQINEITNNNINDNNTLNKVISTSLCNNDNSNNNNNYINTFNYNEELKNELNSKINQITELENIVQSLRNENFSNIDHIKELSSKITDIISEKTKYETLTHHQNQQIINIIQNIINIINDESTKLKSINNNSYSTQFIEYLNTLTNLPTTISPLAQLQTITSYIKELHNEHHYLTNETLQLTEENNQLNNKIQLLLTSINEYSTNMHQANLYLETTETKLKEALDDNISYQQTNEDLMQKLSAQRNEIETISLEVNDIIEQNMNLKAINQRLTIDNTDMQRNINHNELQINELESKVNILNKEIQIYDTILNQICSAGNMKHICSIINDLMNVIEEVDVLEKEKMKLLNEGKGTKGVEKKINEKKSEYNVLYEMYNNELNKISPKKNENTFRKEINTEKYMYSNSVNNTLNSLRSFSPNNHYITTTVNNNNNNYHWTESEYDRINTINNGELSYYNNINTNTNASPRI